MAFVEIGVGTAMLYGAAIGAGTGAVYSGVTGGNVLNGALIGGGLGALGGAGAAGLAGAGWAGAGAEMVAADVASMTAAGLSEAQIAATLQASYGMTAAEAAAAAGGSSASTALQTASAANTLNNATQTGPAPNVAAGYTQAPVYGILPGESGNIGTLNGNVVYPDTTFTTPTIQSTPTAEELKALQVGGPQGISAAANSPPQKLFSGITDYVAKHPYLTAAGVGGAAYLLGSQGKSLTQPNYLPAYTPTSASSMGLGATLSPNYRPYRARTMAAGGIADLADGGSMKNQPANVDFMHGDMYPTSQQDRAYYATPTQMPTSAQQVMASYEPKTNPLTGMPTTGMAEGGIAGANKYNLGSYSDGGRLLKGPGDGMSDNIPATIANKQPARLADGEFVVPADVVSHLGNGSTDAGAKHLYKMMDNVRKARTGRKSQGKQIKAAKYLPK